MAKPTAGLSGNSGHIHISLADKETGRNFFARETDDIDAQYPDLKNFSDLGRYFLAGVLNGLPDIMPLLAPTINSYKRLVENYWAPVDVSWGLEHRLASVRLIAPPTCAPKSTRVCRLNPKYRQSNLTCQCRSKSEYLVLTLCLTTL